jgi:cysteine sulfinate desulfinase/cysteine desulfurase-like protein
MTPANSMQANAAIKRRRATMNNENKVKLGIIICGRYQACAGGKCFRALSERKGAFRGIYVSTGSACSTGDPEPSHVLLAMGLSPKEAQGSIRVSIGKHTRDEDVDAVVSVLKETVERLRGISSIND